MKKHPKYLEKGMKFGRLTVVEVDESSKSGTTASRWKYFCECNCPNKSVVSIIRKDLVSGKSRSCGCYQKDRASETHTKVNLIEDCGDYIKIFFFNTDHGFVVVDKEDYNKVKNYCWCRHISDTQFYALAGNRSRSEGSCSKMYVYMHQIIFPTKDGCVADHKDGNGLNNRKENLRTATNSQNNYNQKLRVSNTSGTTGVYWDKRDKKWVAFLNTKIKRRSLGSFSNKELAIKARKEAEEKYFGTFSYGNSRNKGDNIGI